MADLCKAPSTPQPQPSAQKPSTQQNPCGPNCSDSNGDPHLLTVNRYRYDFQAAGEFTLLQSADSSLEIQTRQEPFGTFGGVSINTAIAAKVGSHRVGVYASGGTLQARVDGTAVALGSPMDLGGGGRIATYTNGFEIDFPDGTKMWTLSVGKWGINALISPSASLRTSGVGLLGPIVPGGLGVPALPDGTMLPAAADRHARNSVVYGQFADAWRVTDSATLFDYDAGQSTATYTIKGYPSDAANVISGDLTATQTAAGTAACSAITDSGLHDDCLFDVGVTGQPGFADSYKATQSFYDSGIASSTAAMQVVQGIKLGGFALGPDGMVYISEQVSPTQATLVEVDPKTRTIVHQIDVPTATEVHVAAGSVWLPGLKTDSSGRNCSVTRFDAVTLAEQATVPIQCSDLGAAIVSDGSAVWFVDQTKYQASTKKGAVLTRIDPATNALGPSVDLPFIDGYLLDSQGALFYAGPRTQSSGFIVGSYYRLTTGASAMESLGQFNLQPVVSGTGLWVESSDGRSAEYFTAADVPPITVPIPYGEIVGGSATAVYVSVLETDSTVWRYPIDGSAPTTVGDPPTMNGQSYNTFSGDIPSPVANSDGILFVWPATVAGNTTSWVFLQWLPLT
jgi:hypothetical protein